MRVFGNFRSAGSGAGDVPMAATRLRRQLAFGQAVRAEVWQLLADALAGGGQASRMLEAVAEGYRLQGRGAVAAVLLEMRAGIGDARLPQRLAPYIGTPERILFEGWGRQEPAAILAGAARILRMEIALRRAVIEAMAMPTVLFLGLVGLFMFFGLALLPAIEEIVDVSLLGGFESAVVGVARTLAARPWAPAAGLAGAVVLLALAMRFWTGPGRALADRIPPFSLQRLRAGAGFLFAVVECGRSGGSVTTGLLDQMAAASPPYAASRIRALADAMLRPTDNLGAAALRAGQGFPAQDLSAVIRALWNEPDGIVRIGEFLDRWLTRIETAIKARMAVLNGVLLVLVTLALLALTSVALPILDLIDQQGAAR